MNIGVVSAFGQESKPLRSRFEEIGREVIGEAVFFFHRYETSDVTVIKTGQGQIRGAIGTELLLERTGSQIVINCGVAGAIAPHCNVGDIIISEAVVSYDRVKKNWQQTGCYTANPEILRAAMDVSSGLLAEANVISGTILSGDHVIDSDENKEILWTQFRGLCVEQEGAAVARVCQDHRVPWIVIRGISDFADEQVIPDFKKNMKQAAKHSADVTFELIRTLVNTPPQPVDLRHFNEIVIDVKKHGQS